MSVPSGDWDVPIHDCTSTVHCTCTVVGSSGFLFVQLKMSSSLVLVSIPNTVIDRRNQFSKALLEARGRSLVVAVVGPLVSKSGLVLAISLVVLKHTYNSTWNHVSQRCPRRADWREPASWPDFWCSTNQNAPLSKQPFGAPFFAHSFRRDHWWWEGQCV